MKSITYFELSKDLSLVYLEDSYVLGFNEIDNYIEFKMLFVLTEQNPFYTPPKPGEQYCYKSGRIIFNNVTNSVWVNKSFNSITDKNGEIDYGNIDSFVLENGKIHLKGEWGELMIESALPKIIYE